MENLKSNLEFILQDEFGFSRENGWSLRGRVVQYIKDSDLLTSEAVSNINPIIHKMFVWNESCCDRNWQVVESIVAYLWFHNLLDLDKVSSFVRSYE